MHLKYTITKLKHPRLEGLHRIQALRSFEDVKEGDCGGFVANINNLQHEGSCWIYEGSSVFGLARILGDARVCGSSTIKDEALVYGKAVVEDSVMKGCSRAFQNALIKDSVILQNAWVHGNAQCTKCIITDDVAVYDDCRIYGVKLKGYARINKWPM